MFGAVGSRLGNLLGRTATRSAPRAALGALSREGALAALAQRGAPRLSDDVISLMSRSSGNPVINRGTAGNVGNMATRNLGNDLASMSSARGYISPTTLESTSGLAARAMPGSRLAETLPAPTRIPTQVVAETIDTSTIPNIVRNKQSRIGDSLVRAEGNALMGGTKLTRAEARKINFKPEDYTRFTETTGISNLDDAAAFSRTLTGGPNSRLDEITNYYFKTHPDRVSVATRDLIIDPLKLANADATLGAMSTGQQKTFIQTINGYLTSGRPIESANQLKSSATAILRNMNASPTEQAKARYMMKTANELESRAYKAIPDGEVKNAWFDYAEQMNEMSKVARAEGNNKWANAYERLAKKIENTPEAERTAQKLRSFKAPMVKMQQAAELTQFATGGGTLPGAIGKIPIAGPVVNAVAGPALDAATRGVGRLTGALGRGLQSGKAQPTIGTALGLGALGLGALSGAQSASAMPQTDLAGMMSGTMPTGIMASGMEQFSQPIMQEPMLGGYTMTDFGNAWISALQAGDYKAAAQYQDIYEMLTKQQQSVGGPAGNRYSDLNTNQQNQLAKLNSSGQAIDSLEMLFRQAGGGQGIIGGNLANFMGSIGLNDGVATYNALSEGLINQIGNAIGKTDALNTEGEVQRALQLVPKITDTQQVALNKIAELRRILGGVRQGYEEVYGLI